jgi:hypothetical protein
MVNPCIAENSTPFGNYYYLRHHCTFPPPQASGGFIPLFRCPPSCAATHNTNNLPPAKPKLKQKFNQIRYQLQYILTHNIFFSATSLREPAAGCHLCHQQLTTSKTTTTYPQLSSKETHAVLFSLLLSLESQNPLPVHYICAGLTYPLASLSPKIIRTSNLLPEQSSISYSIVYFFSHQQRI